MSLSEFQRKLDVELSKLSPMQASAVREEVLAHLDASIKARLEMGYSEKESEEGAVAEFGSLVKFRRKMSEVEGRRGRRQITALVATAPVVLWLFSVFGGYHGIWGAYLAGALAVAAAVLSSRQRRWSILATVRGGLIGGAILTVACIWTIVPLDWATPGGGVWRSEVPSLTSNAQHDLSVNQQRLKLARLARSSFRGVLGERPLDENLHTAAGWVAPQPQLDVFPSSELTIVPTESEARQRWANYGSLYQSTIEQRLTLTRELPARMEALNHLSLLTISVKAGGMFLQFAGINACMGLWVTLFGWGAGELTRRSRKSRNRGVSA